MIENNYFIEHYGKKHCYKVDLSKRSFYLDNSSPIVFEIDGKAIDEKSWGRLLERIANYLINKYTPPTEMLLSIELDWTKQAVFIRETNLKAHLGPLVNDLYINTNHTSLHLCWIIQDLLNIFGENINECKLLIHIPPSDEKSEVREYYFIKSKEELIYYTKKRLNFDDEKIQSVLTAIQKLDQFLIKWFPHQVSLLLFESKLEYSLVKSRFLRKLTNQIDNDKYMRNIRTILEILTKYYAYRESMVQIYNE